jgi:hypothetical protein
MRTQAQGTTGADCPFVPCARPTKRQRCLPLEERTQFVLHSHMWDDANWVVWPDLGQASLSPGGGLPGTARRCGVSSNSSPHRTPGSG